MKIHILFKFVEGAWGGGNQFLKNLKKHLQTTDAYEENPEAADIILLNSHHCLEELLDLKRRFPEKTVIHRIDGPVGLIRGTGNGVDNLIFSLNAALADGTIFQSDWSRERCLALGLAAGANCTTIPNAADPEFFHAPNREHGAGGKMRLIATSWSSNWKKGFDVYEFLDDHLDFARYEMTFIGNSPIRFKNIRMLDPMDSRGLGIELREHHGFITASKDDPCSNSLIEALSCGLPAVVRNSGGHPGLIGAAGEVFDGPADAVPAIERLNEGYRQRKAGLPDYAIGRIGFEYAGFMARIHEAVQAGGIEGKRVNRAALIKLSARMKALRVMARVEDKIRNGMKKWTVAIGGGLA